MDRAGQNYRDGAATRFEIVARCVTPELAHTVWVEHFNSRIGGAETMVCGALRRTTIYRSENGSVPRDFVTFV